MNKFTIQIKVSVLLILLLSSACKRKKTQFIVVDNIGNIEIISGDNQTGFYGEFLNNPIKIKATSENEGSRFLLRYQMIQGNGNIFNEIDHSPITFDNTGLLSIKWRLGCNENIQKIKLDLYVDSIIFEDGNGIYYKKPASSTIINATGEIPDGWGRACGCEIDEFNYFEYSKILSYDNNYYYFDYNGLYRSEDGGVNWNIIEGVPYWGYIVDAQFNSLGWLYILTNDDGICYTKDFQNWEFINNGILDFRYPVSLLVEDTVLFVNFMSGGPYKTTDNGVFWRKLFVDDDAPPFHHMGRHPNGDIYMFDHWDRLWVSASNGSLWERADNLDQYINDPIHDFKIDVDGTMYIGGDDASISVIDPILSQGVIHSFYESSMFSQHVNNIQFKEENVYFTVNRQHEGILYSNLNNWDSLDIGFNRIINSFYLKPDNTFLILSSDGLYYFN